MTKKLTSEKESPKLSRGRPKGSTTKKRDIVLVIPPSCKQCGSTDREPYAPNPIVRNDEGEINGFKYNRVTWKRTNCKKCGQHRSDRIFEMV